jgi:hypothetical protein
MEIRLSYIAPTFSSKLPIFFWIALVDIPIAFSYGCQIFLTEVTSEMQGTLEKLNLNSDECIVNH